MPTNESKAESKTAARIIPVANVKKAPRGRKAVVNSALLDLLKQVKPGFAADLSDIFGAVEREDRSRVSQIIRTHWQMCQETKPSINYTPEGVAQVSHRGK